MTTIIPLITSVDGPRTLLNTPVDEPRTLVDVIFSDSQVWAGETVLNPETGEYEYVSTSAWENNPTNGRGTRVSDDNMNNWQLVDETGATLDATDVSSQDPETGGLKIETNLLFTMPSGESVVDLDADGVPDVYVDAAGKNCVLAIDSCPQAAAVVSADYQDFLVRHGLEVPGASDPAFLPEVPTTAEEDFSVENAEPRSHENFDSQIDFYTYRDFFARPGLEVLLGDFDPAFLSERPTTVGEDFSAENAEPRSHENFDSQIVQARSPDERKITENAEPRSRVLSKKDSSSQIVQAGSPDERKIIDLMARRYDARTQPEAADDTLTNEVLPQ